MAKIKLANEKIEKKVYVLREKIGGEIVGVFDAKSKMIIALQKLDPEITKEQVNDCKPWNDCGVELGDWNDPEYTIETSEGNYYYEVFRLNRRYFGHDLILE